MANPYAGEVALTVDGQRRVMKLTLGALAELEAQMQADTLLDLVGRFEAQQVGARDVLGLIVAGLRGGGWPVTAQDLLAADIEGGIPQAAAKAGEVLVRAFAVPGEDT